MSIIAATYEHSQLLLRFPVASIQGTSRTSASEAYSSLDLATIRSLALQHEDAVVGQASFQLCKLYKSSIVITIIDI